MTTAVQNTKKVIRKKASRKASANVTAPTRASITMGQVSALVKFYEKNNAKVPAFLAKLV